MMTSDKIIIVLLVLFVSTMSIIAQDIHEAAKAGNLELLKKMLSEYPALVNNPDKDKMMPLHHTVDADKLRTASMLISLGLFR